MCDVQVEIMKIVISGHILTITVENFKNICERQSKNMRQKKKRKY